MKYVVYKRHDEEGYSITDISNWNEGLKDTKAIQKLANVKTLDEAFKLVSTSNNIYEYVIIGY